MPRLEMARVTIYRAYSQVREAIQVARHTAPPEASQALNAAVLSFLEQTITLLQQALDLVRSEAADRRQLAFP